MGHEELIKALEDEGLAEIERLMDEARLRAKAAEEEAAAVVSGLREERLRALEERTEEAKTALVNRAELKARGAVVRAKYEIIEAIVDEAVTAAATGPDYPALIDSLYEELKAEWPQGPPPAVLVNPADKEFIKDKKALITTDPEVCGGVVFVSGDGRVRFTNTLSARLDRVGKRLFSKLDALLFSS